MKVLVSIDPGASGAIAIRDASGRVFTVNMPDTLADLWLEIHALILLPHTEDADAIFAYIEDAGYHVQGNNASASCKFARHCGSLEMALTAARIPWASVRPQKWMKHYGALPKEKKDRKNRIKELMQRRFPLLKVTLTNSDALAMLAWSMEHDK